MIIREFDPNRDYPAVVSVFNANFPAFTETEAEFRYGDDYRDASHHFARVVGEVDGTIVGYGQSAHSTHGFHPQKFTLDVMVDPSRHGHGHGKALYEHVVAALAPLDPITLRAHSAENQPRAIRFLEDRNFREEMRFAESWLDVPAFDPSRFPDAESKPTSHGIRFVTLAELRDSDPEIRRRLYELTQQVQADIPSPEPHQRIAYEIWEKRFAHTGFRADAHFIALDADDAMVGLSTLWGREADDHLQTGVTGVLRSHRRMGIALALKLRAVAYARAAGAPIVRTDNETNNEAMLSINRALGFVKQPDWILFVQNR